VDYNIRRWYVQEAYKSLESFLLENKGKFQLLNCANFSGVSKHGIHPIIKKVYPFAKVISHHSEDMCNSTYKDNFLDMVMSEWVLEHVRKAWEVPKEIYRILKPTGLCYMLTSFVYPVHMDKECGDYLRFTEDGLKILFESAGFKTIEVNSWGSSYINYYIDLNKYEDTPKHIISEIEKRLDEELIHPEKLYHHKNAFSVWGFFQK